MARARSRRRERSSLRSRRAGRSRSLPGNRRAPVGDASRPERPRRARPWVRQPPLLARPRERPPDDAGDRGRARPPRTRRARDVRAKPHPPAGAARCGPGAGDRDPGALSRPAARGLSPPLAPPRPALRLGLVVGAAMGPAPGVPPSAASLAELTARMKEAGVKLVIAEPSSNASIASQVAARSGARLVTLVPSVGGDPEARDYPRLFEVNVRRLTRALAGSP